MRHVCLLFLALLSLLAQDPNVKERSGPTAPDFPRLPNGKSQREEIVKGDHKKNIEEAGELARLTQELKDDLDKGDAFVVSVKTFKKLDDIENLARRIRGRLKRY